MLLLTKVRHPELVEQGISLVLIRCKNVFNSQLELPGNFEGQRQAGVIAACLNGIDGLTGNFKPVGKVGLAPAPLRAKIPENVFHRPTMLRTLAITAQADIIPRQIENMLSRG